MRSVALAIVLIMPWPVSAATIMPYGPVSKDVFTLNHWPDDIGTIPCAAWKKTQRGDWRLNGTLVWADKGTVASGMMVRPSTPAGMIVEDKCGEK